MSQDVTGGRLGGDLPAPGAKEFCEALAGRGPVRIERIVSRGHASPPGFWYDQAQPEWVMVLAGAARLRIEGEEQDRSLGPGDWLNLPPRVRHRVTWTDPGAETVWLAVFY